MYVIIIQEIKNIRGTQLLRSKLWQNYTNNKFHCCKQIRYSQRYKVKTFVLYINKIFIIQFQLLDVEVNINVIGINLC